jgi:hypothetical protein
MPSGLGSGRLHSETWRKPQHLQVPLLAGREGFVCSASQRSTTIKDVLIHLLGNALTGAPRIGWDSGAEDIPYGICTHQKGLPC